MGTSGVGAFAVDEGAVPEFEDDEGHDLLEVEELAGFHAGEESADGGWVEVAAGFDLGIAERVGDEVFEFRVFEEEFEREEERDFGAMAWGVGGHACEGLVGETAFDPFVGAAAEFEVRRHAEGEFDEPVVEEGQPVLEAVGHGVFVLTDEGPVLEPFIELKPEEAVEHGCLFERARGTGRDRAFVRDP